MIFVVYRVLHQSEFVVYCTAPRPLTAPSPRSPPLRVPLQIWTERLICIHPVHIHTYILSHVYIYIHIYIYMTSIFGHKSDLEKKLSHNCVRPTCSQYLCCQCNASKHNFQIFCILYGIFPVAISIRRGILSTNQAAIGLLAVCVQASYPLCMQFLSHLPGAIQGCTRGNDRRPLGRIQQGWTYKSQQVDI